MFRLPQPNRPCEPFLLRGAATAIGPDQNRLTSTPPPRDTRRVRFTLFPTGFRPTKRTTATTLSLLLAVTCGGCQMYRSIGKGQHMDPARHKPHHDVQRSGKEILVEITTDPAGAVADIRFQKSSGSEAVDNYVAETIRSGWPPNPSTKSLVRLQHTANGGFSQPEIVSSAPLTQ